MSFDAHSFLMWVYPFYQFFLLSFVLCCPIQEIFAYSNVMKLFLYFVLEWSNGFSSSVWIFVPFRVSFCICCKVRVQVNFIACRYAVFPAPLVEEYLFLIGLLTLVEIHLNYSLFLWSLFYSIGLCLSLCQDHTVLVIAAYSRFWNQEYETFYFVIFQDYFRYLGSTEAIYAF